jgi:DNA polymerase-1
MMTRGIRVDHDKLAKVKKEVDRQLLSLEEQITERCGRWVNPLSPKDCQTYFYIEKKIPPYTKYSKQTGKSSITTDDKTLQRITRGTSARKGLFEAKLMQDYRRLKKLKGTYLDIVFDTDSRMRCNYKPRGTKFGRLSSTKTIFGTGMNMQNLPEAFLGFLIADLNCIFIELDLRRAEWVVVAYDSGDANMLHAIKTDLDVHSYTASQMFGIPIEAVKFEDKILGHIGDPEEIKKKRPLIKELDTYKDNWMPRTMSMRQCGKKSNHGLNYGEGKKKFALDNEITEKEAEVVVERYHGIYPGIRRNYERIQTQLGTDRTLTNCFGRKCRFLDRWNDDLFKSAYSFNSQSTVGEIINRGMVSIYNSEDTALADWEILRQVHDSINFQAPTRHANKLAIGIRTAARDLSPSLTASGREFTIAVDCKIGYSLDRMKEIEITDTSTLTKSIERAISELKET